MRSTIQKEKKTFELASKTTLNAFNHGMIENFKEDSQSSIEFIHA